MAGKREEVDGKEDLLLVPSRQGHKGYKRGLVSQQLTQMEESLLVCSICNGILYNACNYGNGQGMCCQPCLGVGEVAQGIGAIRAMVSNLRCQCPLSVKGCEWEGVIQGVWGHLDSCSYLVVSCHYEKYGCDVSLKRGQLDTHRREAKEYHTELVMVHLGNRLEEQAATIEQDHKTIERLDKSVSEMKKEREYYKKNEVVWRITQVKEIQAATKQQKQPKQQPQQQQQQQLLLLQQQQQQLLRQQQCGYGVYATPAAPHNTPTHFTGPVFQLDSYNLTLQLEVTETGYLSFSLVNTQRNVHAQQQYNPLGAMGGRVQSTGLAGQQVQDVCCQVKCKLTFYNKINSEDDWVREIGPLELKSTTQSLPLADISSVTLLSKEFSHDDTILLQLLYSVTNT